MPRSRLSSPARVAPAAALATAALLLAAAPAGAAPSCSRGGATILAASARTRVVSIPNRPKNAETRRDHILGCRVPTGRRFELLLYVILCEVLLVR